MTDRYQPTPDERRVKRVRAMSLASTALIAPGMALSAHLANKEQADG
jgi:hypothetical protein